MSNPRLCIGDEFVIYERIEQPRYLSALYQDFDRFIRSTVNKILRDYEFIPENDSSPHLGARSRDVLGSRNSDDSKPLFRPGEDRLGTLTWPCQMPFDPEPDGVIKVLKEFAVARGESGAGAGGELDGAVNLFELPLTVDTLVIVGREK